MVRKRILFVIGAIAAAGAAMAFAFINAKPSVQVDFLNVGQGDAILIRSGRIELLIDGGPDRQVLSELGKTMPFFDRTIEYVVLTHPHADHFTGLNAVFDRYRVGHILISGARNSTPDYAAFERNAAAAAPVSNVLAGDVITLGQAKAEVFWPRKTVEHPADLNDASVVLALTAFGKPAVTLMGDATMNDEELLMPEADRLRAPVLKVGHHGSKYSSSTVFLEKVAPTDAVIEVGKNTYGHPAMATLMRLKAAGTRVWRTDHDGTVEAVFTADGYRIRRKP